MVTDGICQKTYQWFYDEVVSQMADETEKAGHIMCDELQIKSTLCWNTQSHALVGFVTDTSELNFIEELKALESTRKEDGRSIDNQSDVHDDDKIAQKINQWRLRTVQGQHHNGKFWLNNGCLSGNELMWQFAHVLTCYEAI